MGKSAKRNREKNIGLITELKRFATHDGPGIRTTVFTKGCPLGCKWCSNPETQKSDPEIYFIARKCKGCGRCVEVCPEDTISINMDKKIDRENCTRCMACIEACQYGALEQVGTEVTTEELFEKIKEDRPFYVKSNGGITISGGEPLRQSYFISNLFHMCQKESISTVLDTCGYAKSEVVEPVLRYVDLVLLDLKHMNPAEHERWTGVSNELILKNAEMMTQTCEVRISLPLMSGVNDSEENIRNTSQFAAELGIKYIDVVPFHRLGDSKYEFLGLESPFSNFEEPSNEKVLFIMELIESYNLKVTKGRSM